MPNGRAGKRVGGRGISSMSESPFSDRAGEDEREELEDELPGYSPYRPPEDVERAAVIDRIAVTGGEGKGGLSEDEPVTKSEMSCMRAVTGRTSVSSRPTLFPNVTTSPSESTFHRLGAIILDTVSPGRKMWVP